MAPVYPIAPGHPDFSSTGTTKFIPQIWSGKLVEKFYKATVFAAISNTDYEGEISAHGDKVIIRTTPNIVIRDYVKGQKLIYTSHESPNVELNIDKGKYFAFPINDVDKKQADINFMDTWSDDASEQMKITIDNVIINDVDGDAHASNKGTTAGLVSSSYNLGTTGSPVALDKSNVIEYIVDTEAVLAEQNVPESNRWLVIPGWVANLIKKSDLKDASLTGDETSVLRNGRIGRIDTFTIYVSNNYNVTTDGADSCYSIIFGHKSGLTFASQMVQMESIDNPDDFGQLVRGLNIYGYEVIKPESIGVLYAKKG